jgi:hypothetical protein
VQGIGQQASIHTTFISKRERAFSQSLFITLPHWCYHTHVSTLLFDLGLVSSSSSSSVAPVLLGEMAVEFDVIDNAGIGVFIAAIATILAIWCSLSLIGNHLFYYSQPHLQRPIVRILLMVPIYAINSFLSLVFSKWSLYLDLLRDCYEAYVVYSFFHLLIAYIATYELTHEQQNMIEMHQPHHTINDQDDDIDIDIDGSTQNNTTVNTIARQSNGRDLAAQVQTIGEQRVVAVLESKDLMAHPFPMCCAPNFKPGASFLQWCKRCIYQFIIIKPLMVCACCDHECQSLLFNRSFGCIVVLNSLLMLTRVLSVCLSVCLLSCLCHSLVDCNHRQHWPSIYTQRICMATAISHRPKATCTLSSSTTCRSRWPCTFWCCSTKPPPRNSNPSSRCQSSCASKP